MKGSPVRVRASALKALLRGHFWELLSTFTRNEKGSGWESAPTFYVSCRDFRHLALVRLCPTTSKRPPSTSLKSAPSNASVRLSLSDGRPGTDGWASWRGGRGGVLRPLPPGPFGAPRVEGRVSCRPGPAGLGATTASLPSSALIQEGPRGADGPRDHQPATDRHRSRRSEPCASNPCRHPNASRVVCSRSFRRPHASISARAPAPSAREVDTVAGEENALPRASNP